MTQGVFLKKLKRDGKTERVSQVDTEEKCCKNPSIMNKNGEYVCQNCGCVFSQVIDDTPSFGFSHEERMKKKTNERVYSPIGPRTTINGKRDARGNSMSPVLIQKYKRLAKIHKSLTNSKERNLWKALPVFRRLRKTLKLPDHVYQDAVRIYDVIVKKKLTLGRTIRILVTASVYCALRANKIARTIDEMAEISQFPKKKILQNYKLICRKVLPELDIEIKRLSIIQYVDKFNNELDLPIDCRNLALKMISHSKENGLRVSGKNPKGIVGAALYLSAKQNDVPKTQKDIANRLNIAQVTLRMRIKELKKYC
ncbi:MAG: transcription initiation factor IIB [Promethearchaeia archaeon]